MKAKLFLDGGTPVPPGSRIVVKRGDTLYNFTNSGIANVYPSHTELFLRSSEELL
jgi:hypothetical protein